MVAYCHAAGHPTGDGIVSRWWSPRTAARRAERAAKATAQRRQEKRRSVILVIGVALVLLGLMVGDYFWLRYQARQRHEQRYHRGGKTNAPAPAPPLTVQSQATNHE